MKVEIVKDDNNKFALLAEFEVGNSGHFEQRIICTKLSLKKAQELKDNYNK